MREETRECPVCGQSVGVAGDGTLNRHGPGPEGYDSQFYCPGSEALGRAEPQAAEQESR